MRFLGIDYGKARIGTAIGHTDPAMAMPLSSVSCADQAAAAKEVAALAKSEGADRIIVGLPVGLGGETEGESADGARAFAELLKGETDIPVEFEDERLTTAMIERIRVNQGLGMKGFDKDASAAAALLETYIDRLVGPRGPSPEEHE
jgi:putative Holliday junction resolvase